MGPGQPCVSASAAKPPLDLLLNPFAIHRPEKHANCPTSGVRSLIWWTPGWRSAASRSRCIGRAADARPTSRVADRCDQL